MFQKYDIIYRINSCTETVAGTDRKPIANPDGKISLTKTTDRHDVAKDNRKYCDRFQQP